MHSCSSPARTNTRPSLEVADVLRRYGGDFLRKYSVPAGHLKVMRQLVACRTAALGGHVQRCRLCGFEQVSYNSCRNRHCPKCQSLVKEQWLNERRAELLPTGYFHMVFTLPHNLNPLILCNKRVTLNILFASVNETLQSFAGDPQWRLVGKLGFIAVLHTWSQTLLDHFHLHCLIPAGALSFDKKHWIPAKENFLFRNESLAKAFRSKFLERLKSAYKEKQLTFPGTTASLAETTRFGSLLASTRRKNWIVYSKRPFAGPRQVLDYLARYTHRVALTNERIKCIEHGKVTFTYRDRSDNNRRKVMTLEATEFIRRFLLHVLPGGFMKIRYFGFLSHRCKKESIALIRRLIAPHENVPEQTQESTREIMLRLTGVDIAVCPRCGAGELVDSRISARFLNERYLSNFS